MPIPVPCPDCGETRHKGFGHKFRDPQRIGYGKQPSKWPWCTGDGTFKVTP